MKKKNILFQGVLLVAYILIGTYTYNAVRDIRFAETSIEFGFMNFLYYLYFILFGVVLGFGYFLNETSKNGKWIIQWQKLLIQGIPMAYVGFHYFIYFSTVDIISNLGISFFIKNEYVIYFGLIALGYVLITSTIRKD